jgi:hypothetical protein
MGVFRRAAVLCVAACGLIGLPALSQEQTPTNFLVGEAAKRLVPLRNAPASGSELTLKEHEMALFAGIAVEAVAILPAAMTVATGEIAWAIPADSRFVLMTGYSGADADRFAANTSVWCELRQREPRKETKDKALIAQLKKSHEQQVTLCLLDAGNDGSWDKVIVTAAKRPDLRRSFDIAPTAYQSAAGGMLPKSYIAVKFHHQNAFHTPRFYVEGFLFGKPIQVQSLTFTNPDGSFANVLGSIETPPGKLPVEMRYGEARFTVAAIDSSAKTAQVRIERAWGTEPIKITRISYSY